MFERPYCKPGLRREVCEPFQPAKGRMAWTQNDDYCSVCQCDLPINRSGHVPRETRRDHNNGSKHQTNLNHIRRREEEELKARNQRALSEWRAERLEVQRQRRLAVVLGVLATRLRARYGSMDDARIAWAEQADSKLATLQPTELRLTLRDPARQTLAWHEMREIVTIQDYEMIRMLFEALGWTGYVA